MTEQNISGEKFWIRLIYIISFVITLVVAFLILGPRPVDMARMLDVTVLPLVNALLNTTSALLLLLALWFIKKKNIRRHKFTMLSAFSVSTLFLITYVIYHWFKAGPTIYIGNYPTIYYFILLTHIVLAIFIIPMGLVTLHLGWNMKKEKHRRMAKITYPIWLYVSVTGVVIYLMLY